MGFLKLFANKWYVYPGPYLAFFVGGGGGGGGANSAHPTWTFCFHLYTEGCL